MNLRPFLISDKDKALLKKLDFRAPSLWLATWFGCGFLRPAPGTWGSLGALPPGLLIAGAAGKIPFAIAILLVSLAGLWAARRFEAISGEKDSKMIVIDEVAGQWIALWPLVASDALTPALVALSFILFRFFDIVKPWPVSFFDKKVPGAAGVMGDDIAAGLLAALTIGIIRYAGFG